jgi:uncharacterized protein with HEPN domain
LPFKDSVLPLRDILESIASIEEFTHRLTFEAFERDLKTIAAVECKLQIVSEAAFDLAVTQKSFALSCRGTTYAELETG